LDFDHTIKILSLEIHRIVLTDGRGDKRIKELQTVIKILQDGKAILRKDWPIAIRYFSEL